MGISIDGTKKHVEVTPPLNKNKQDYTGGTNDKTRDSQTCETGDSRSYPDNQSKKAKVGRSIDGTKIHV